MLILLTAVFILITIAKSFHYSIEYGGSDLRCRVVGSRLLATGHSPYFYKWKAGDSELLLDPNANPNRIVNGNVATPAVLYSIYPLSKLSYPTIRFIWTILQILAGFAVVFLVIKRSPGSEAPGSESLGSESQDLKFPGLKSTEQFFAFVIVVLGLFCSEAFLYHVERGQVYVFFALFFALSYYLFNASFRHHEFVSGFVGGIFVLFRPIAAVIGLGFLINGKFKWLYGFATGLVVGCLLFVAPRPALWQEYFSAMKAYNNEMLVKKEILVKKEMIANKEMLVKPDTIGKFDSVISSAIINRQTSAASLPAEIEGSVNLQEIKTFNIDGLQTVQTYLRKLNIEISNLHSVLLYAILICLLTLTYFRVSKTGFSSTKVYLFAFLAYILAELCMIAPRSGYNIIEWMFPLGLIYISIKNSAILVIGLLTAVVVLHGFPIILPYQSAIAESVMIWALTCAIFRRRNMTGLHLSKSD
ncbi:glycosyltransferase family 87 protein [Flavitalea sp.]|nr:glycosyltransferase family 87 protein [Flavitalea sp.]